VSVIYGVTPEKATPAWQALQAYLPAQQGVPMSFGGLQYWDDPKGDKTTLVVNILEPRQVLTHLHDRLAQAAQIGSRFAYHPHTTLIYLKLGTRFDAQQEAAIQEPLRGVTWQADTFYLTDPCGGVLHEARTEASTSPHP
jgi:2'-5' RNA ligase